MNLVQFLAAGVNGALNGTATFFLRGTASSAEAFLYNEFEGISQPGTNVITLDANGAAEVYCDVYVDVELRTFAGDVLRTVTVGNSAPVVEVQSDSFTGTDYDGSPSNTIGEPITLKAVLDKWIASAGAPDWHVIYQGVDTDIQTAFAASIPPFINVKDPTYGALGDGVTDDTTAILAATIAANGGIVFFPAGTYKLTTLTLTGVNVNWWGSGAGSTIISGSTSTNLINLTDNTISGWKNFREMSFTSSGSYSRLFTLDESQNTSFRNCVLDASLCSVDAIEISSPAGLSKLVMADCDITLGASTPIGIRNIGAAASRHISIKGCHFTVPSGFTGRILRGASFNVDGCRFDASAVTSGVYRHIDAEDAFVPGRYVGNFTGNKFLDGGSAGFVFELTSISSSCDFSEDGNTFVGFDTPDATTEKGQTYEITDADSGIPGDIHLGSRTGRTIHITLAGTTFTASMCLEAEHLVIESTSIAGPVTITVPALIPGLSGRITLHTTQGGGSLNYVFDDSAAAGPSINRANAGDEALTLSGGSGSVFTGQYYTTVLPDGTFRSLVTSEIKHA